MLRAVIRHGWYDIDGRKYIDIEVDGLIRRVKVPFRYKRVMCHVDGVIPIQLLPTGTHIDCVIENVMGYNVLKSIRPL